MGAIESKLAEKLPDEVDEVDEKGSIPSTPILTPKFASGVVEADLDPRSPSKNISRTPIHILNEVAEKLEQISLQHLPETPLKNPVLSSLDPRSPTIEFQRTPIVLSASPEHKLPTTLRNKNLDRVLASTVSITPVNRLRCKSIPPKLLESTPASHKNVSIKRRSISGVLETNIDFTETDLDSAMKEKYSGYVSNELEEGACVVEDPRSPTTDFLRTPIQIAKDFDKDPGSDKKTFAEILEHEDTEEVEKNIVLGVKFEDSVSFEVVSPIMGEENAQTCNINEENYPEDKDLPSSTNKSTEEAISEEIDVALSVPETVIEQELSSPSPRIDLTADVRELDKKLTNLIYEDKDLVICPRIVKIKDLNRTPLGLMNSADNRKPQKLKVSDKPRKSDYAVSKIPVFKEKKIKGVQCENTPPRSMTKAKTKRSQWDVKDDTLVI